MEKKLEQTQENLNREISAKMKSLDEKNKNENSSSNSSKKSIPESKKLREYRETSQKWLASLNSLTTECKTIKSNKTNLYKKIDNLEEEISDFGILLRDEKLESLVEFIKRLNDVKGLAHGLRESCFKKVKALDELALEAQVMDIKS